MRAQIREKERQRLSDRNKYFEEGIKLDEEARQRQLKLEEVKRRKLEELRLENCISVRCTGRPKKRHLFWKYVNMMSDKLHKPDIYTVLTVLTFAVSY